MWKLIIGAIVIVLLGAGGFLFYQQNQSKKAMEGTDSGSEVMAETPTPTPTPEEVQKDEFSIEIQNGSGIAGEAGRAKTLLEDEEFVVDSTGNADNYDYDETIIQAKETVSEAWTDALIDALKGSYDVQLRIETLDDADSDSDVVVIIGKNDENGESMVIEEDDEEDETTPSPTKEVSSTPSASPSPTGTN